MTEKRFNFKDEYITLDGGVFATAKNKNDAELISKTLNQLYSESEELKHQFNYLEDRLDELIVLKKENNDLEKEVLSKLQNENKELQEEIQLLKEGMEAYENAIPYVCTCEQVRDIHSEMFDFNMKQNEFYKEHLNRCTVIIDGVRYE